MSEPYTPTTDDFRQVWAAFNGYGGLVARPHSASMDEGYAEFDRWLEQVKAEARREYLAAGWAEGEEDGRHNERVYLEEDEITNPYRQEASDE